MKTHAAVRINDFITFSGIPSSIVSVAHITPGSSLTLPQRLTPGNYSCLLHLCNVVICECCRSGASVLALWDWLCRSQGVSVLMMNALTWCGNAAALKDPHGKDLWPSTEHKDFSFVMYTLLDFCPIVLLLSILTFPLALDPRVLPLHILIGSVDYTHNPTTWEARQECCFKFETSLGYKFFLFFFYTMLSKSRIHFECVYI